MRLKPSVLVWAMLFATLLLISCGGGGGTTPAPVPSVSVTVTPSTATLAISASVTFSASVANSTNTSVTWSVQEGASGGTITSAGVYTAPNHAGLFHVVATSQADPLKSAATSITVTAPAPVFSSTPPSAAVQDNLYSYSPSAIDPGGLPVTFSLTTAPTGATISSGLISWTPAQTQSRIANTFVVTATTTLGGTATQSWSVTPTGNVVGTRMITYVTDAGNVNVPGDASAFPIAAYVPNGPNFDKVTGVGLANGTFTIPNVAPGYYWLQHGSYYFWTSTSNIDTGYDQQGRPGVIAGSGSVYFNLTGATVWQSLDQLHVYSSNANNWVAYSAPPFAVGGTSIAATATWNGALIDASQGDRTYVTQLSTHVLSGFPVQVLSNALGPLANSIGTGTASVSGVMQALPASSSVRANIKGSSFAAALTSMNPMAVQESATFALDLQPGGSSKGWLGSSPDLVTYRGTVITADTDLGSISYGNPYPATWAPFVLARYTTYVPYLAQGATTSAKLYSYIQSSSTTLPTSTSAFGPLVGPPTSPVIDGSNFFNDHSTATSPNVAWHAPLVGSATGYTLSIYRLSADVTGTTQLSFVATLHTKQTSLVVPPNLLTAGSSYVFELTAVNVPGKDIEQSPYRHAFPSGYAQTSSGVVRVQ